MIRVYCYLKCSTCQKALRFLDEHHLDYELIDIKSDHPSEEVLKTCQKKSHLSFRKFFNTSGVVFRQLDLSRRLPLMTDEEQLQLLASDGMMVKRPLLIAEDDILLGFHREEWERTLLERSKAG